MDVKRRVEVEKRDNKMHFYLVSKKKREYLFTQCYSKSVYDYFCKGKSVREIQNFKKWDRNPRLEKTMERMPQAIDYVLKETA